MDPKLRELFSPRRIHVTTHRECEEKGIWAWDSELNELVLLIPAVLALLGDNPMQSEFACHIGLRGKLFCRACWVKGSDGLEAEAPATPTRRKDSPASDTENQADDPVHSRPGSPQADSPVGSDAESTTSKVKKSRGKRVKETLEQMMSRAKSFVKIGKLRTREETTATLRTYFEEACTVNTKTKLRDMRTSSGIKDTFRLFFLEKLFESYKGKKGTRAKQDALDAKIRTLPDNTTSPVWRIKGLDSHQDTPVEILHVILLGFVKYMWRDVVQNQLKNKDELKKTSGNTT
ncbi:hypothetical protein R3P38DRAFT_3502157 [Favolaschia claudopus]|uniref:Uncharacterized protein n=1 Tax=Favolaschia claudopus TaxID=2862362 RepID=A0AAV9Z2Z5_9AGAR